MNIELRPGSPADAEAAGIICFEAFRLIAEHHRFVPDFPSPAAGIHLMKSILGHPRVYSVVAELGGRVVGSNFLWESAWVAGVGPITVDPQVQNGQVGRALMNDVMERAERRRFAGIRLVQAAYHGRSLALYTKLGFDAREPLSAFQGPALVLEVRGHEVRAVRQEDLPACDALCRHVHGHDRGEDLADALSQGTATVVERGGHITGYATRIGFFGHAVAETNDDLKALIGRAPDFQGPGFLVPTRNGELMRWCLEHGLRIVQPMTLMSRGLYNKPRGAFLPSVLY